MYINIHFCILHFCRYFLFVIDYIKQRQHKKWRENQHFILQKVLADVKQFKNKNSSIGLWDNLMVFFNEKTKHILVHKRGKTDFCQKSKGLRIKLYAWHWHIFMVLSKSLCLPCVGRVLMQAGWDLCASPSFWATQTYISKERPSSLFY